MRFLRPLPPGPFRHLVAFGALLAQVIAATGAPVLVRPAMARPGAVPFPCLGHPCGCSTSEQGWAGDCCCFTLEEKLAWADARGITPPEHVRPTVARRQLARGAESSCCAKRERSCCETGSHACPTEQAQPVEPVVRWVAGMFAQKCRGESGIGLLKLELISVPARPVIPRGTVTPVDSVREAAAHITPVSFRPPTPPPRIS